MINHIEQYKEKLKQAEKIIKDTTIEVSNLEDLSEEEIVKQNNFIIDFIVTQ